MRKRINYEELKFLCELRDNGRTASDFRLQPGRHTYSVRMKDAEWSEIYAKFRKRSNFKRLFFDIETSPNLIYSFRTGYNINITYENIIDPWRVICIAYKWEGDDKVYCISWDKETLSDKQLLLDFIQIANTADEIVAHNGDKFDIRKLRTRCIYHRIPMFPKYQSLDTWKKSKDNFSFISNSLNAIANYLGLGSKLAHEGFNLWIKCMHKNPEALKTMMDYCKQDVTLLEDVYMVLQPYVKPNTHVGATIGNEKYSCPICGGVHPEFIKIRTTEKGSINRLVECRDCNYVYEISNRTYQNYITETTEC